MSLTPARRAVMLRMLAGPWRPTGASQRVMARHLEYAGLIRLHDTGGNWTLTDAGRAALYGDQLIRRPR